jgi:biotin-(acetyl-CoA carboxylase) ligase
VFSAARRPRKGKSFSNAYVLMEELKEKVSGSSTSVSRDDVRKTLMELEIAFRQIEDSFSELERSINALALMRLTEKQQSILKWLCGNSKQNTVYTRMIEAVSKEFKIPESTARWNLKILREVALLEAGDRNNKGIPVRLTEAGRIALEEQLGARTVAYEGEISES